MELGKALDQLICKKKKKSTSAALPERNGDVGLGVSEKERGRETMRG